MTRSKHGLEVRLIYGVFTALRFHIQLVGVLNFDQWCPQRLFYRVTHAVNFTIIVSCFSYRYSLIRLFTPLSSVA
jgi:hypothetical protein